MNKKRLEREQESALIAGVLAGLAQYFNQDPVLFRLAAIGLLIVTGVFPGLILYLVAWVVMPKQKPTKADYVIKE